MRSSSKGLLFAAAVTIILTCLYAFDLAGLHNEPTGDGASHAHNQQVKLIDSHANLHDRGDPRQGQQALVTENLQKTATDSGDRSDQAQDHPLAQPEGVREIKAELKHAGSIELWSEQYVDGAVSLDVGVKIAKNQAPLMKNLMRIHPDSAYEVAMSEADWRSLPPEVRQHVARRFSGHGHFEVTVDSVTKAEQRQVTMSGFSSNNASVSAGLENHKFYEGEMIGVALANDIAVTVMGDEVIQPLAAAELYEVYATGNYKVLWLNVKYSDEANHPSTISAAENSLAETASKFLEWSYGRVNMTYTADEVSISSTKGVSGPTIRTQALAEAVALGYTISDYDTVIFRTSNEGNYTWVWGDRIHLNTNSVDTTIHEIGHCMGLHHANFWRVDAGQPSWGTGTNVLYGDGSSVMGRSGDFGAYEKKALGWLDVGTDYAVDISQGTYRIYAYDSHAGNFDDSGVTGAYYAASIFKDDRETHGEAADRRYCLSWRNQPERGNGYNRWYQQGLLLHFEPWTRNGSSGYNANGPFGPTLIDAHTESADLIGANEKADAALYIGETYLDNDPGNRDGDIYITPLTKTDPDGIPRSGDEYVDVKVVIGNQSGNLPPTGTLVADKLHVMAGEVVNLEVDASDEDDTVLAYYWDFGLAPTRSNWEFMKLDGLPTQTFSWPVEGIYSVRVIVSDCRGGTVELTQEIIVGDVHMVTFDLGENGTRIGGGQLAQSVINGGFAVAPTVSPNTGYIFYQWDRDFSNVTSDLTVYAEYRSSSNLAPEVEAGARQTVILPLAANLGRGGSDHFRVYNDGSGVVGGAYFEWEASHEMDGDHIWESTTENSHDWIFSGNLMPEEVADGRFDRLTHAFDFPAAKVASGGSFSRDGAGQPATFEFVIQIDGDNGSIFETGGSGEGMQIDIVDGLLRGTVQESTPARAVYELTPNDYGRFMHVVFIADQANDEVKLYVDGELKDTQPWTSGNNWSGSNAASLGSTAGSVPTGGSTSDFIGKMGLFRYYRNKVFTTEEVHINMESLSSGIYAVATLNATVTDPEGDPFECTWSLVEGPGSVYYEDPLAVDTTATFYTIGTYILRLTATDGLAYGSDEVTIEVKLPSFETWIAGYDLDGLTGMHDDPDGDKQSNLMEFAFGTDPSRTDIGPMVADGSRHGSPILVADEASSTFDLQFLRRVDHEQVGITYEPCFSDDLSSFEVSYEGLSTSPAPDPNYEVVKVPFPSALLNGNPARFGCVRVNSTAP